MYVVVPEQGVDIGVRTLPLEWTEEMKEGLQGRSPGRLVINFELFDEANPDEFLTEFEVPIEVWVRYTSEDAERAWNLGARAGGGGESFFTRLLRCLGFIKPVPVRNPPLDLSFWDGERWIWFTEEKHDFELAPRAGSELEGFGFVRLRNWGDPAIRWGP